MHVYLDQKDWVYLLKASAGRKDGAKFEPALTMLTAAAESHEVTLPLSHVHYIETNQRRPYKRRVGLARVMATLSAYSSIAPFWTLARAEIRQAIATYFDSRVVPDPPIPFGLGVDHAFGTSYLRDEVRALYERHGERVLGARDILEWGAIAGHPDNDGASNNPVDHMRREVQRAANAREDVRRLRTSSGWHRGARSRDVAHAQAYMDWQGEILAGFREAGVARVPFGNKEGITWFLESVPTIAAETELRRLKEETTQRPWTINDFRDIDALSVALVYAEVVVTEKSWGDMIRRSKLEERFGTTVLSSLVDLPEMLVTASRVN